MDKIVLNKAQVLSITGDLLTEFGEDYVYQPQGEEQRCDYVRGEEPSCIVGQILYRAGVPLGRLREADAATYGAGVPADNLIMSLIDEGVLSSDVGVIPFLAAVQREQDAGEPWGSAVRYAKRASNI